MPSNEKPELVVFNFSKRSEEPKSGVLKYATIFSFCAMVFLWEVEIIRVIGKIDILKSGATLLQLIAIMKYDTTMLLVTLFTFISSVFYIGSYNKKKFAVIALILSLVILLSVAIMNLTAINTLQLPHIKI